MEQSKNAKLSKVVLDMKFMKKTKDRIEKEEDDAEGQAMYSSAITEEMRNSGNINFTEVTISTCKDLIEGRLSFKGMNPHVEKLMMDTKDKWTDAELKKEKDISDFDMAKANLNSTLDHTMKKKFMTKKNKKLKLGKA